MRDSAIAVAGEADFVDVMANHPALLDWYFSSFYGEVFSGVLMRVDLRSKEILRLRLSRGHGCHVCNSYNALAAKDVGLSDAQIEGIAEPHCELFDARDTAVIELAAQIDMGNNEGHLSKALYDRLRVYFDDAQIVELALVAGILTGFSKFLFACDLVTREDACPIRYPDARAHEQAHR